ncbi:MAG: alpha/beta hydrolase [Oscillatoriales cyanobacterium RM2_1_1]|nr:alpha/beta hydrolase [Oscillatoriales cyanobacterium SM2_3_0]NJO44276.1 alpha/beta hydrolase [Oscillatoriales cyanobacterium RM2_1_1]
MHPCLPDVVWLNTSPSLQHFDQELIAEVSSANLVAYWEYQQSLDEPSLLSVGLTLVHDYLKSFSRPVHLIGHSTGGLLGLLYARQYPKRVKSLTLLSVGVHPAIDWKSHYYVQQQLLPCSRQQLLRQMVRTCGIRSPILERKAVGWLELDLMESFSLHSPIQQFQVPPGGVSVPLLICGSLTDDVIGALELQKWKSFLKEGDRLCQFPQGGHFFHYFFPEKVKAEILQFWAAINQLPGQQVQEKADCYN